MMKQVHLIGIGGSGLSAIARVLLERGVPVSGSDRQASKVTRALEAAGARVIIGHQAENIQGASLVVRSSAVADDNPEVQAAIAAGVPVLKRADYLAELTGQQRVIAIAGTHGKTTTTSMIAWMLTTLGQDPSYIVGGDVSNLGTNAHAGSGDYFVIEADEYDRMFLGLTPEIAVVTNIEHDHPDCYPTLGEFYQAFQEFAERLAPSGKLLGCVDDPGASRLLRQQASSGQAVSGYGMAATGKGLGADYYPVDLSMNGRGGHDFGLRWRGEPLGNASLQVPGLHNVLNALAALAVAHQLQLDMGRAVRALSDFRGTSRRFEIKGQVRGILVIDDYAHHPTEIRATLAAARARYPRQEIWAVWQPHTYSRTRTLFDSYLSAFANADHVLVTDIFAAREQPPHNGFSAQQVVQRMDHPDARFIPDLSQAVDFLIAHLQQEDVLIVLSAGDADQVSAGVLRVLA
jgi:UDP-N-acetylmuramate--alanine ligase